MGSIILRKTSTLLPSLVITAALAGCAHEHHHHERVVEYGPGPTPAYGEVAIIDDPDPFIVERERYYLRRPEDIRVVDNVVYDRGVRIHDAREERAARLAFEARERGRDGHVERAENHSAHARGEQRGAEAR